MEEKQNKKIAVLIDAENVSYKLIDEIFDEIALHGRATHRRAYGDFGRDHMKGWNSIANEHALHQVTQQSYTNGKNSSDSVLIINAMDILYSGNVDAICLVTSDSDFTRLAMRVVESGLEVIGMGEEKTSESFVNACTTFKYIGSKKAVPEKSGKTASQETATGTKATPKSGSAELSKVPKPDTKTISVPFFKRNDYKRVVATIKNAIINTETDSEGWTNIGPVGSVLYNRFPDFDPMVFGAKSKQLSSFLKSMSEFEVEDRRGNNPNASNFYIRIRK